MVNMELKFKETNKTFHKIVEFKGEKYLLSNFKHLAVISLGR